MKLALILIALIGATNVNSYAFRPKKVYVNKYILNQIVKNKPDIDKNFAKKIAYYVDKHSKKYKADPYRAIAIAMQESGYRNIVSKISKNNFDVGMFQINVKTIKEYNLDQKKLINNVEYAVESYFKIVTDKKRYCKYLKEDAWVCYHSKTKDLRLKYKKMVNKYYPKKAWNENKIAKN